MLIRLRGLETLFRNSKLVTTKHRETLSLIEKDIEEGLGGKLKVVPFEAISALSKIYQGDLKSFVEAHIESHVCTNLSSLCREYPYRIKYSVYNYREYLTLYSECIDVEILSAIIFGDIIRYFEFVEGYRDNIPFKYCMIPGSLFNPKVYGLLNTLAGYVGVKIEHKHVQGILEEISLNRDDITELIFSTPCMSTEILNIIKQIVKNLTSNPYTRVFIVTPTPSIYDAKNCRVSYREFFTSYIEALDFVGSLPNVFLCNSEMGSAEIIINRAVYLTSYDAKLNPKSEFVQLRDRSYIENFTLKYLRDCLCSSRLTREIRRFVE